MRDKPLITYLIVNICLDLAKSVVINKRSVLRPNAMIILAFHWPCEGSECGHSAIGHLHWQFVNASRSPALCINRSVTIPSMMDRANDTPRLHDGRSTRSLDDLGMRASRCCQSGNRPFGDTPAL